MRMNKSTGDAIRILVDCARSQGELVKVGELAERVDMTMQNVFKIVHLLSRAGLVTPVRGRNGGVRLSRDPEQILIGDVVRALESTDVSVAPGGDDAKNVEHVFDAALEAFIAVLDQHSLADMVAREKRISHKTAPRSTKRSASAAVQVARGKTSRANAGGVRRPGPRSSRIQ